MSETLREAAEALETVYGNEGSTPQEIDAAVRSVLAAMRAEPEEPDDFARPPPLSSGKIKVTLKRTGKATPPPLKDFDDDEPAAQAEEEMRLLVSAENLLRGLVDNPDEGALRPSFREQILTILHALDARRRAKEAKP